MRKEFYQSSCTAEDTKDPTIKVNLLSSLVAKQLIPLIRFKLNVDNEAQIMQAEMLDEFHADGVYGCTHTTHAEVSRGVKELVLGNMIIVGKYNNIFMNPHYWWVGDPDRRHAARIKWDNIKSGQHGDVKWAVK